MTDHLPAVRRLRDEKGWGCRQIGNHLGIGKDAALRLLNKLKLEDANRSLDFAWRGRPEEKTSVLGLYTTACRALGEARDIITVKDIGDRAGALKEYARLANDRVSRN